MPRDKDLPKKYDIPRERYRELKYFCLQYPRKKGAGKRYICFIGGGSIRDAVRFGLL